MPVTDEHKQQLGQFIAGLPGRPKCPVCQMPLSEMIESADIINPYRFDPTLGVDPARGAYIDSGVGKTPILRLFCPRCGHVLHFKASQILDLPEQGASWL